MIFLNSGIYLFKFFSVSERSDVSKRDTEVLDRNRWRQRQSVRGAVRQSLHSNHDAAQTGNSRAHKH